MGVINVNSKVGREKGSLRYAGGAQGAPVSFLDSFLPSVRLSRLSYWLKGKKRDECFILLWNERSNKSSVLLSRLSSFIVLRSVCQINS